MTVIHRLQTPQIPTTPDLVPIVLRMKPPMMKVQVIAMMRTKRGRSRRQGRRRRRSRQSLLSVDVTFRSLWGNIGSLASSHHRCYGDAKLVIQVAQRMSCPAVDQSMPSCWWNAYYRRSLYGRSNYIAGVVCD